MHIFVASISPSNLHVHVIFLFSITNSKNCYFMTTIFSMCKVIWLIVDTIINKLKKTLTTRNWTPVTKPNTAMHHSLAQNLCYLFYCYLSYTKRWSIRVKVKHLIFSDEDLRSFAHHHLFDPSFTALNFLFRVRIA